MAEAKTRSAWRARGVAGKRPPEMRQTLDRAQKFLSLVALLAALLSAVAVALAARGLRRSTSTPRPCCACWGRASAPLRGPTPPNLR